MPKALILYLWHGLLLVTLMGSAAYGQVNQQELPQKTRILFLLDGSGSMLAPWENTTRIMAAKRLLAKMVDSLQANQDLHLALRVYGHQFPSRPQVCEDSKLEVGFGPNNHQEITKKLMAIKPQGNTPIAYSLSESAKDFPMDDDARNIIIIITDGLESCDGDPCQVSYELQKKRIFLKPFVIGIGMDKNYEKQFGCLGQFFDANNIAAFQNVLNKALRQTLDKTTVSVELLDIDGNPKETDVNVTFVNNVTGEPAYNFVHYRDSRGKPDSVEIDAVVSYDMVVNTLPQVVQRNLAIRPGEHNVLSIRVPRGTLTLQQRGHTEYDKGVKAIVRKAGSSAIVNILDVPGKEQYLVGNYDIEVLTLPRKHYANVQIDPNANTVINIPAPGLLNINASVRGIGSLYELNENGQQRWLFNLPEDRTRLTMAVQPGHYQMVFRANSALGSKYTEIKKFSITSGSTTNLKLFGR